MGYSIGLADWLEDCETLFTAVQYGMEPGGWNPDRVAEFQKKIYEIEGRMRLAQDILR